MDIYFLGRTAVRLRGKKTAIVIDPFTKEKTGIPFEITDADAVLMTRKGEEMSTDKVREYRVSIDGPGEYEVGGVGIMGMAIDGTTTYYVKIDGVSLLHLGALAKELSDTQVDKYPGIDILFIAPGKDTPRLIAKLEPAIVVPIGFTQKDELAPFVKELGKDLKAPQSKLTITKDKLPQEMEVVILE